MVSSAAVNVSGSTRTQGNTIVWFPAANAGPVPWRLYVKLAGVEPTELFIGPATPAL